MSLIIAITNQYGVILAVDSRKTLNDETNTINRFVDSEIKYTKLSERCAIASLGNRIEFNQGLLDYVNKKRDTTYTAPQ